MTPEELEVWKELNELECVKKAKIRWFIGDKLWDDYGEEYGYIIGFNQIEFLDRHVEDTARVKYYSGLESNLRTVSCEKFWIVPLFDPIRPERSLWGIFMTIEMAQPCDTAFPDEDALNELKDTLTVDNPDLAIAKAIIERDKNAKR